MALLPDYLTPEIWVRNVFDCTEAKRGGVLKRQTRDIERLAGRRLFLDEAARRGFQVLENGRHFIVLCNTLPVRRVR